LPAATRGLRAPAPSPCPQLRSGQLGNRQALRVLEISRITGARLIVLGDNEQTGAIEQGKAFWLLQKLGLSTAELTESVRQETRMMKAAVTQARLGNYAASLENLDKVVSGGDAEMLAKGLVAEWTRLKPEKRANTNILVLENATRLIVNTKIREALKTEGAIAAEEARLSVLTPSGMTDQEKHFARFYSGGQVLIFSRDNADLGIARDAEYRVIGIARDGRGRQVVQLVDEHGRTILWDPRVGKASQVNVFREEQRDLAKGDRIQWRLVNKDLDLKNAERGTVEGLAGSREPGDDTVGSRWPAPVCRPRRAQDVGPWLRRDGILGAVENIRSGLCVGPGQLSPGERPKLLHSDHTSPFWREALDRGSGPARG